MDVSLELVLFRKRNRVQAQQLSRQAEISPWHLSRVENGWANADEKFLEALRRGYAKLGIKAGPFIRELRSKGMVGH